LPDDVAAAAGYDVVVADTVNHALRGMRVRDSIVTTVAGTGRQRMTAFPVPRAEMRQGAAGSAATDTDLSSPWDVVWSAPHGRVIVAMAGTHQLASFDPVTATIDWFAGTGHEGLVDGTLADAWFAQSSGLAADVDRLWVADSETSALRYVADGVVHTAIGRGLFSFGHRDGPGAEALLQHPLGVGMLPDGSVAVCDTYNGAIRRYDRQTAAVSTLATGLAEPSDAVVVNGRLVVVESAAHRLVALPLAAKYLDVEAHAYATKRASMELRPGPVQLRVVFTPPTGQHFDERDGPATRLVVEATPPSLLLAGAGAGTRLERRLVVEPGVANGVLHVTARAATCDMDDDHAACHLHQQDWGIPVIVAPAGGDRLELMLRGMAG
jgi:hypothetical protein